MQRFIGGRAVSVAALASAGATVVLTDAQGLAAVLVLMTSRGTAIRSCLRAGVLVAAAAGALFVAVIVAMVKATGVGFALTDAAGIVIAGISFRAGKVLATSPGSRPPGVIRERPLGPTCARNCPARNLNSSDAQLVDRYFE